VKLTLWPSGEVLDVDGEKSLLEQLVAQGKKIKSSCGGHATCGDCVVKVMGGEEHLPAPGFEELRLLGNVFHITKERLSCQLRVKGDVVLDISGQDKKAVAKKPFQKTKKGAATASGPKGPSVIVRKRDEVQESAAKSQEKDGEKKDEAWYRHWEKPDNAPDARPRPLGGGKRPRAFTVKEEDPTEE
jgi:2Fe-2S ferredoxin